MGCMNAMAAMELGAGPQQLGPYQMVSEPSPSTAISPSSIASEGAASLKIFLEEFLADLSPIFSSIRHDLSSINSSLGRCIDHAKGARSSVLSSSGSIDVHEPAVITEFDSWVEIPQEPQSKLTIGSVLASTVLSTTIESLQDVQALETRSIENPNSTVGSQVDDIYGQDLVMEESFVIPGSATVASPVSILATSAEKGGDAHKEPGVHLGDFSRVLPGLYSPTGCFSHGEIKIRSNSVIGSQSRVLPGVAVEENVIFGALSVAPSDATLQRGGVCLGSATPAMVKNTLHDSDERVEDMEPEYRRIVGNLTANLAATTMKVKSRYFHQIGAEDNLQEGMKHTFASFREGIPATEAHTQQHNSSFILDYFSTSTICLPAVAVNPIVQQHVGNSGVTFGVEIKSCVDASAISTAAGKTSSIGSSFPVSVVKVIPLRPPPKPPWLFHLQALHALQLWKYYDPCHMLINCSRGVTGFTRFALQLWTLKMHGTCSTKCCNVLAIVK